MICLLQALTHVRQDRRIGIVALLLGTCSLSFGIGALLRWLPPGLAWISVGVGIACLLLVGIGYRYGPIIYRWLFETIAAGAGIKRLHLGCGYIHKESYLNVDIRPTRATDLVTDCTSLHFPSNSIEVIESCHLLEHLSREDGKRFSRNCHRMLQKGGRLITECPDFSRTIELFWEPPGEEANRLENVYGCQRNPFEFHHWGYFPESIRSLLLSIGFSQVQVSEGTDYHTETEPCMRVEAIK